MPELHIWFNDDYPEDTLHIYPDAARALIRGKAHVDTTQICLCTAEWLCKGYMIVVHPSIGEEFNIMLDTETPKGSLIKPWSDLPELLIRGEFDSDDPEESPRSTYVAGI